MVPPGRVGVRVLSVEQINIAKQVYLYFNGICNALVLPGICEEIIEMKEIPLNCHRSCCMGSCLGHSLNTDMQAKPSFWPKQRADLVTCL